MSIRHQLLTGIFLFRISSARESCNHENQINFRPTRGYVGQIFILRQILEQRHRFSTILWSCLSLKEKIASLIQSLQANSQSRVPAYGPISPEFNTKSAVSQSVHSPFFSIHLHQWDSDNADNSIDIYTHGNLSDLECTDNAVLQTDNPSKLQVSLDRLNDNVGVFLYVLHLPSLKYFCRTGLAGARTCVRGGEELIEVDKFT